MPLQETIKFRTTKRFKMRYRRIARADCKDPSDLGREILEKFVESREAELRAQGKLPDPAQKKFELEVAA